MKKAGLLHKIPSEVWNLDWNVNSQAVGSSEASIKHLAPYVFRVAISNSRIVQVEDHKVFYRYRKTDSRRLRTMPLPVMEFIRRFLQHVLPTGFIKVRHYGFMSPTSSVRLDEIKALIPACACPHADRELAYGFNIQESEIEIPLAPYMACPHCGGILKFRLWIPPMLVLQPG